MNYLLIIANLAKIFTLVLASYFFWKGLKEEYPTEEIFTLTLLLALGGAVIGKAGYLLLNLSLVSEFPQTWFPLLIFSRFSLPCAFLSGWLILTLYSLKKKLNPWQIADGVFLPFLWSILGFSLVNFVLGKSIFFLALFLLAIVLSLVGLRLKKTYRSISWYKSGKIGFLACFLTVAFFGLFLLLEIFFHKALYWEELVSLAIIVLATAIIYQRSERSFKEDRESLFHSIRKLIKKNGRQN